MTAVTIGVGTWIWSQRSDGSAHDVRHNDGRQVNEREERSRRWDERDSIRRRRRRRSGGADSVEEEEKDDTESYVSEDSWEERGETSMADHNQENLEEQQAYTDPSATQPNGSLMARFTDTIRRTPSPLQVFERVGRTFGFGERERWQEEVERREVFGGVSSGIPGVNVDVGALSGEDAMIGVSGKVEREVRHSTRGKEGQPRLGRRKVVVMVLDASARSLDEDGPGDDDQEQQSSIIDQIQYPPDIATTQLLILAYAPQLHAHPLSPLFTQQDDPALYTYNHISDLATSLIQHPTHILPFTTSDSHINLLKHIAPDVVYLEQTLASVEIVSKIQDWVGQVVVVADASSLETYGRAVTIDGRHFEDDWRRCIGT